MASEHARILRAFVETEMLKVCFSSKIDTFMATLKYLLIAQSSSLIVKLSIETWYLRRKLFTFQSKLFRAHMIKFFLNIFAKIVLVASEKKFLKGSVNKFKYVCLFFLKNWVLFPAFLGQFLKFCWVLWMQMQEILKEGNKEFRENKYFEALLFYNQSLQTERTWKLTKFELHLLIKSFLKGLKLSEHKPG